MGTMSRRACPDIVERTGSRDVSGYLSGVAWPVSGVSASHVRISVRKPIRTHGGYIGNPVSGYRRVFGPHYTSGRGDVPFRRPARHSRHPGTLGVEQMGDAVWSPGWALLSLSRSLGVAEMSGRGRTPKDHRRNPADIPKRGEWQPASGIGWQHGPIPAPPEGLTEPAHQAWQTWMGSWFAAHWAPGDVPGLYVVIRLYNEVVLGRFQRSTELRLWMDTFGVTPKGQADRRWQRPEPTQPAKKATGAYDYLRVVEDSPA